MKEHELGQLVRVSFTVDQISVDDGVVQITSLPVPVQHFGQNKMMMTKVTIPADLASGFSKNKKGDKITLVGKLAALSVNSNHNAPDSLAIDNVLLNH